MTSTLQPGNHRILPKPHYFTAVALTLLLFMATAAPLAMGNGPVKLDFPSQSPGIPAYARLELLIPDFDVPHDDDWAAIVFYRNPECVPLDFDLGQFFHFPGPDGPGAFGCQLLIEGSELWTNGPEEDLAPVYARSRSAVPGLPIWFVAWPELSELFDAGTVYIDEIEALPSLIRGQAWWFEESLHPNGSAPDPAISLNARGRLESGGRFLLDWHYHANADEDEVLIELGRPDHPSNTRPPSVICVIHPYLPACS
ncbi:hypothetical protein [Wenzhouxiangella sp. EGI_FJ10305]|uniref:hypothetical protein n=1 Tax=Wenzhouxiangella sp. EGI_FJ10305 TaxID=3243768 RepID=UPI0035D9783F